MKEPEIYYYEPIPREIRRELHKLYPGSQCVIHWYIYPENSKYYLDLVENPIGSTLNDNAI
jgi:hypothetical protein